MRTLPFLALGVLLLGGCCGYTRTYVQPVGPLQALTVHTTPVYHTAAGETPPRIVVTRHYMGERPSYFHPDYYLPEPTVIRSCDGVMYIEEYVFGFPPVQPRIEAGQTMIEIQAP